MLVIPPSPPGDAAAVVGPAAVGDPPKPSKPVTLVRLPRTEPTLDICQGDKSYFRRCDTHRLVKPPRPPRPPALGGGGAAAAPGPVTAPAAGAGAGAAVAGDVESVSALTPTLASAPIVAVACGTMLTKA